MADLRGTQLKNGFQTLVTIGSISETEPTNGALTNGKDQAITQVTLSSGSASAPSYSFTGDANTGLFRSGADAIGLVTGGTSRLAIDSSGNVGIGGTATAKLDVHHADEDGLRFTTADGAQTFIDFGDASDNNIGSIRYDHADNHMRFLTNNAERIRMFSDGDISFMSVSQNRDFYWDAGNSRLGLGTSSPDYKLHLFDDTVTSSKKTLLQFDSNNIDNGGGYNIDFRTSSNDTANRFVARIQGAREGSGATSQLSFFTDDGSSLNQRMLINASGNVGIGTSSPDANVQIMNNDGSSYRFGFGGTSDVYLDADNVFIRTDNGGANTATFTTTGLGIGTNSPSQPLEIHEASSTTTANDGGVGIVIKNTNNTDNNQASLEFLNSGGTKTASIISTFIDHSTDEGALSFAVGDGGGSFGEAMRITANKRIGIGTSSPSGLFHVKGDTNSNGAELFLQINNNNTTDNIGAIHFGNNADSTLSTILSGTSGNNTTSHLTFSTSDTGTLAEAMRIDKDGNVGIGTTSPENNLHISGTNSVAMTLQAPTHDSGVASTATMNFKYQSSGGAAIGKIELVERGTNSFNGKFVFGLPVSDSGQSTRDIMTIDFNGDILPAIDSLSDIGSSSNRFVDIHADNGTIQTSDRNQKQDFEQITEAEAKVAQKAKGLLTKYKWKKDVEKYGDDAQYHIGIIAQELIAAFEEEGLDYKKYAMIYESEHLEDSGEITTYYGVRYTELLAFIISTL